MASLERYEGAPIHPLGTILVMALDYLWVAPEAGATLTGIGIVTLPAFMASIAVISFIGVFLIQKFTAQDSWGSSFAKAFVMAVIAAVPYFVASTVVGTPLLAWAGISAISDKILKR